MGPPIGLDSGYSRRSLARLAFSAAAADLSDRARSHVHTEADKQVAIGEFIENAAELAQMAEQLLNLAVVLERERGMSWESIGEVFGVSRQGAQQKYGARFDEWLEALDEPLRRRGSIFDCRLPNGPDDPERQVARLDAWLARDREPRSTLRTVSRGLEQASLVEQVADVARQARRIGGEKDAGKVRAFLARKTTVLTRIVESDPDNKEVAQAASEALHQLAELDRRGRR